MEKDIKIKIDEKCFIRILNKDDVTDNYVMWLNDYEVTKYTEQKYVEHHLKSVHDYVKQKYESGSDLLFGIFHHNVHIGNVKLGPIKWQHKSTEISYFIGDKTYWGKGIASKVIKKVVEYGADILRLEKFNAGYHELNIGSARVFQKCGFCIEGVKKGDFIFEGRRINSILVGYQP